jgi:dATP pyrophosphohydrolase
MIRHHSQGAQLLLLKRCITDGGFWSHVAGGVKARETAIMAIEREIIEETQVCVPNLYRSDYIETFYQPDKNRIMMMPLFVTYLEGDVVVQLNQEHTEYRWVNLAQAKEITPYASQHRAYEHVWQLFVEQTPNELLKIY